MEAGGLGEGSEVTVARDERNVGVHTVLLYQGIGEAGTTFPASARAEWAHTRMRTTDERRV